MILGSLDSRHKSTVKIYISTLSYILVISLIVELSERSLDKSDDGDCYLLDNFPETCPILFYRGTTLVRLNDPTFLYFSSL